MKISLKWIFDHIDGDVSAINVTQLVDSFIKTTAEIEEWREVFFDVHCFTLVEVIEISGETIVVQSPELNKKYAMPERADIVMGAWYLVKIDNNTCSWATIRSIGGTKDTLLPTLFVEESLRSGGWKRFVELSDHIIDIDNKSINHRPDLWGHRGIAREIAAILHMPLKNIDNFIMHDLAQSSLTSYLQDVTGPFSVAIQAHDVCKRFAALYIESVHNRPSSIDMVVRLSRLDARSIDFLVDCTNYVMFDLGQPMHAFDAHKIHNKNIIVRRARDKEQLLLLDSEKIALHSNDIVIADEHNALSLAGVMGGATTGVSAQTDSLLLEVAHFDAATVRRTATRYKKRTEASMRFEKNMDPNHIDNAIARFIFLLNKYAISYKAVDQLVVLGHNNAEVIVELQHGHIEQLLGIVITSERVSAILEKICFEVEKKIQSSEIYYFIKVPSFRATKDVAIAEDIIEEIGRYIGYDAIDYVLPTTCLTPPDLSTIYNTRRIKRSLTTGLLMREIYGYSFFDELFLREIKWDTNTSVELKNPISEHFTRLVTTLQPNLLKAIKENSIHHDRLRFYEWGRVWSNKNDSIDERKMVSGIFFEHKTALHFYEGKTLLSRFFHDMKCDVTWEKNAIYHYSWFSPYQVAQIMHNNTCIGVAGMVNDATMNVLSPAQATAFVFELDADYLMNYTYPITRFIPLPKYPTVRRDISVMVPLSITVDDLVASIKNVDTKIRSVHLIDFFSKDEWENQKSLTFHIEIRDNHKTLEHDEVEGLWNAIAMVLQQQGAVIR